jgi:uncharacterized protein
MDSLYFLLSLAVMLIGLAGTILPVIPGIPLIYLGYLSYGLATSWRDYGLGTMLLWGLVTCLSLVIDYMGSLVGARRSGSSILGLWGSFAGAVIGFIVFSLPGLIIGTFAGAVIGELMAGRPTMDALRSGRGAIVGFLAGSLIKAVAGLIMVGAFLWQVVVR